MSAEPKTTKQFLAHVRFHMSNALSYTRRAAARALKLLAYEEAARAFELSLQALELLPSADPVTHCELLLGLGEALAREGRTAEAKRTYLAAADLARVSGRSATGGGSPGCGPDVTLAWWPGSRRRSLPWARRSRCCG